MPLKILVIHSTSLVGKSTTVASLLHPRLKSPRVFSVEKQNQDASRFGIDVVRYRAPDFKKLMEDIIFEPRDLIVDVGASQYVDVMKEFARLQGSINDFDAVIVPTTPDGRVQEETLGTIDSLRKVGLEPARLRVLFNRATLEEGDDLELQFEPVIAYLSVTPALSIHKDLIVYENAIHSDLRAEGLSFQEVSNDKIDYRKAVTEALRKAPQSEETLRLVRRLSIQRAVASAKLVLDAAFLALRLPTGNADSPSTARTQAEG